MSTILYDLKSELRRLMVAGGELAREDVRLKKILPLLEKAGEKSPVFKRLAEQTAALTSTGNNGRSQSLLEEGILVNAVIYTQAVTGREGKLQPFKEGEQCLFKDISYRQADQLLTALTTKGADRYGIIDTSIEEGTAFDTRFMPYMAAALADSYSEIGRLVAGHLHKFGKPVVKYILQDLDISKGTEANINRIEVLSRILQEEGKDIYLQAYEDGHTKLKAAALEALAPYSEYEGLLEEAAKGRHKECKMVAFRAFSARKNDNRAYDLLADVFNSKKYADVVSFVVTSENEKLLKMLTDYLKDNIKAGTLDEKMVYVSRRAVQEGQKIEYPLAKQLAAMFFAAVKANKNNKLFEAADVAQIAAGLLKYDSVQASKDLMPYLENGDKIFKDRFSGVAHKIIRCGYSGMEPEAFYDFYSFYMKDKNIRNAFVEAMRENMRDSLCRSADYTSRNEKSLVLDERWFPLLADEPDIIAAAVTENTKSAYDYIKKIDGLPMNSPAQVSFYYWYWLALGQLGKKNEQQKVLDSAALRITTGNMIARMKQRQDNTLYWLHHSLMYNYRSGDMSALRALVLMDTDKFVTAFEKIYESFTGDGDTYARRYLESIITMLKEKSYYGHH